MNFAQEGHAPLGVHAAAHVGVVDLRPRVLAFRVLEPFLHWHSPIPAVPLKVETRQEKKSSKPRNCHGLELERCPGSQAAHLILLVLLLLLLLLLMLKEI